MGSGEGLGSGLGAEGCRWVGSGEGFGGRAGGGGGWGWGRVWGEGWGQWGVGREALGPAGSQRAVRASLDMNKPYL